MIWSFELEFGTWSLERDPMVWRDDLQTLETASSIADPNVWHENPVCSFLHLDADVFCFTLDNHEIWANRS